MEEQSNNIIIEIRQIEKSHLEEELLSIFEHLDQEGKTSVLTAAYTEKLRINGYAEL